MSLVFVLLDFGDGTAVQINPTWTAGVIRIAWAAVFGHGILIARARKRALTAAAE